MLTQSAQKILPIALNTFRESIRSKILYATLFMGILLVAISACFGMVTIGDQIKVVKDFGLFAVSISGVALSIISGATLLNKELSRKTIYNILSKPVARWHFVIGKYLGLLSTATLMAAIMTAFLVGLCVLLERQFDPLLLVGFVYVLFELTIISALAIFFSCLVTTPLLGGLFTFGLFLAGRSANYFLYFVERNETSEGLAVLLKGLYWGLPNLAQLQIANSLVYGLSVSGQHLLYSLGYALSYSCILLILGSLLFERREFS